MSKNAETSLFPEMVAQR